METEFTFFWFATILYGLSAFFYILNLLFKKEKFIRSGTILAWVGFLTQTLSLAWYWLEGGQGLSIYSHTVTSRITGTTLMGVLVFLLVQLFVKPVRPAGLLIMPINFLLLFWVGVSGKEIGTIPAVLTSWWFWVHVISGGFAYGFVLIAGAVALLYLLKRNYKLQITDSEFYEESPELKVLDNLNYRFVTLGFIMLSIMIISGSFWANQVHSRYWGWDPIEVQSLVSWLIYAIWLHLRLTFGWRGRKLAWYSLFAPMVIVINLVGVPFIEKIFHSGFRIQH